MLLLQLHKLLVGRVAVHLTLEVSAIANQADASKHDRKALMSLLKCTGMLLSLWMLHGFVGGELETTRSLINAISHQRDDTNDTINLHFRDS